MRITLCLVIALIIAVPALPARADTIATTTGSLDGTINGLRNGKLSLTLRNGMERQLELDEINSLSLDAVPDFARAEAVRDDALKASALYRQLIAALNKPELKLLAEARAIDPLDRNNQWTDAVALFLDVYQNQPTDVAWKLRPTHAPPKSSKLLAESADRVAAAVKSARTDEARANLRRFLLEIDIRAEDTQAADRVAKELKGIAADPPAASAGADATGAANLAITAAQLETTLRAGNFDQVIQQADAALAGVATFPGIATTGAAEEAVAQLFSLKARALEGQNNLAPAAAGWLRIPTYLPNSTLAPTALLHAAALQEKLGHLDESQALLEEIRDAYPESPEAARLKSQ